MTDKAPRCPLCGGVFIDGTTTFTVELGFGVAVVRDVPARVCKQCGDASLTTKATRRLEAMVESARASRQEVSITRRHEPWGYSDINPEDDDYREFLGCWTQEEKGCFR